METRPNSNTLTCASCGKHVDAPARFCGFCGQELAAQSRATPLASSQYAELSVPAASYLIPTQRVLLMTLVSHGLYFFYWFYLTWKHYQEHTGEEAYPVWHALSLLVPIYSLFRIHAHMRSFRDLMNEASVPTSINALMTVFLIFGTWLMDLAALQINGGIAGAAPVSEWGPWAAFGLTVLSILILAGVVTHVQGNLNRYWQNISHGPLSPARIYPSEVFFCMIGVLTWIATFSVLLGLVDPLPTPDPQ